MAHKNFVIYTKMPKRKVQEEEVPAEEAPESIEEAPEPKPEEPQEPQTPKPEEEVEDIPEKPPPEKVPKPKRKNAPKAAPKKTSVDLKAKHQCGACGKVMSVHTALYNHKCPGEIKVPQPPALVRSVKQEPVEPEPPVMSHAQLLRLQLAQAAQERRAQAQLRMTAPIRQFYGT